MLIASSIITLMAILISTIATLQVRSHPQEGKVGQEEQQVFAPQNQSRSFVQLIQPRVTVKHVARYQHNEYIGVNVQGEKVPHGGRAGDVGDDDGDGDGDRNDGKKDDDADDWKSRIFCKRDARGGAGGRAGGGRAGGSKAGGIRSGAGGGISPAHRGYRPNGATTTSFMVSVNSLIITIALNVTLVLLVQGLNILSQ